jgi:Anti-sigma-K factor rskA
MAPGSERDDPGRHDSDESANDRARVDYLARDIGLDGDIDFGDGAALDAADRAELDGLRALLADSTLWVEPASELEDSVVALITAEARTSADIRSVPAEQASSDLSTRSAGLPATAGPTSESVGPARPAADQPIDLAAARHAKHERAERRRFARPVLLVAAAAAVVAFVLTGVLFLRDSPSQRRFDVALSATELAPGASGTATMLKTDSGWEIQLDATGLPRLDGGQFYQAWLRNADGVLVPIGTFNEGTDVTLWAGVPPDAFSTMTITKESADGIQDSSGQRVLVGTAVED